MITGIGYLYGLALRRTEMIAGNPQARPERIPIGHLGTTEQVAEVAVMLARNGYNTGQTISVGKNKTMG